MSKSIQASLMSYEPLKQWTHRVRYSKYWILAEGEQEAEHKASHYARLGHVTKIEAIKKEQ